MKATPNSRRAAPLPPKVAIDVALHDKQMEIFSSQARFRIVAAGRRFGKTVLAAIECLIEAVDNPGAMVWWVAPTSAQTRIAKRQLTKMLPRSLYHINNSLGEFTLLNGSRIFLRSAERYDNLRGEGVDFLVIDEAAKLREEAWTEALRATLSDRGGKALFIGTFQGENWFWRLWDQAASGKAGEDWAAFRYPTSDNPYIPQSEIDQAARDLPREVYLQEYEASPMSYVGMIFDGELLADAAARGRIQLPLHVPPVPASRSVEAGLDWGWHVTALEVACESTGDEMLWIHEVVFEHVELNKRCREIADVCQALGVEVIYADAAGATENHTLAMILDKRGLKTEVQPVPFNLFKDVGIQVRRYYLENRLELIGPHCTQLLSDSKRYHWDPSGDKPAKGDDHTVDAGTALYASRGYRLEIYPKAEDEVMA